MILCFEFCVEFKSNAAGNLCSTGYDPVVHMAKVSFFNVSIIASAFAVTPGKIIHITYIKSSQNNYDIHMNVIWDTLHTNKIEELKVLQILFAVH
jgi:hypothetical protein